MESRKDAERRVRHLNETLEDRIKARTVDLEQLNAELDQFAASVSHDLRAPLRAIVSFSQILQDDFGQELTDEGQDYLQEITSGGEKLNGLIDSLLTFSRNTREPVTRELVDLSRMAKDKLQALAITHPTRYVDWHVDEGIIVSADPKLADIVLDNVIGNAWKYTSKVPHPSIRVFATWQKDLAWLHVADNGAGFDMQHAGDLFKPFKRLHTAQDFEGVGVGLSTVRRIIRRHGGQIEFTSLPHQGTTFWFNFGRD
jgi:light-regulated signal transduction histidine kinase (bacteriophytochrome)